MNRATLLLTTLVSSFFFAACGGTTASSSVDPNEERNEEPASDDDDKKDPTPSQDPSTWPQTTSKSRPWPWFGGGHNGVVTAPEWQPPVALGCEVETTTAREPDRDWLPGEGPREVVIRTGAKVCRPAGTHVVAYERGDLTGADVDAVGYTIIVGSCKDGFRLATRTARLAKITFDSAEACETYESARNTKPADGDTSFLATELSVVVLGDAAELRFVSSAKAKVERADVIEKQ